MRIPPRGSLADADLETKLAGISEMLADGWTPESALNHVDGTCDVTVCSAPHGDDLALVCNNCGEAFTDMQPAYEHGVSDPQAKTWCGNEGFSLMPYEEAF